jgi:oxygen-independent coproporphyrinogen III oxidase
MPGLYIHIPFCVQKCLYCDFFSCDDKLFLLDDYLEVLFRELKYYRDKYNPSYETLFIGGGTPTIMTEKQLDYFFTRLYGMIEKKKLKEITIEANPETVNEKTVKVLAANVDRISIGAQSFDAGNLMALGRIHGPAAAGKALELAKQHGIERRSIDMMYGLPGQSVKGALADLNKAVNAGVEHISYYMLTVYENTPFVFAHEKGKGLPGDGDIEKMYFEGVKFLESGGFMQYEISNFAKPGRECLHNLNYWNLGEYAGLGAGASSYFDGLRYTNVKNIEEYIKRLKKGDDPAEVSEKCTEEMKLKEYIMLKLRTKAGINYGEFRDKFNFDFKEKYSKIIGKSAQAGTLVADGAGVRMTLKGFLLSNTVISEFF